MKRNKRTMTFTTRLVLAVTMMFSAALHVHADNTGQTDKVGHAIRILKGIDTDRPKAWAVEVLNDAATKDSSAYAMNVLGLVYMAGVGVEQDSTLAISWLKRAGQHGFHDAYCNLGMMYKDGKGGVRQNFHKAYEAFMQGAEKGSTICKYDAGFMLYKGLGCRQDYGKAIILFEDGAEADYTPSLYMLGLCYRNGYGVEQDTVRASAYLKRAAILSFRPAMEELLRPNPENYLHEYAREGEYWGNVPERMPNAMSNVNDISLLYGTSHGFLAMYDWSGQFLLGEKPITMTITPEKDGIVSGTLVLASDTVLFNAILSEDGRMRFSSGSVKLAERYTVGGKVNYRMDEAVLDVWENKVAGRLSLYSMNLKEPERPMYMELSRVASNGTKVDDGGIYTCVTATPNPFRQDFTAAFELAGASEVQVRIFDKQGMMVYRHSLGMMPAGKHTVDISPDIKNGTYVLNIKAGKYVLRTIIVKNGGTQ